MKKHLLTAFIALLLCSACHSVQEYSNPIIGKSLPDPSVIKAKDGYYYLYATENIRNLPIYRSKNLTHWEFVATAFTDKTRPTFVDRGNIWAPDIQYIGRQYVLYYSMSVWGGEWQCGIGVATADRPEGPFTDHGRLFRSNEIGVKNSIDPFYIADNGKHYLFWGSFRGIYYIELTPDGLSLKPEAKPQRVAGTAYEGTNLVKRNGYYYLFASTGSCCEGNKSTYTTVVGRSKQLTGPFTDKQGRPMLDNHHETIVHSSDRFVGTGHNSTLLRDKRGNDWMIYHAFIRNESKKGRVVLLDRMVWKDGWPEVERREPALTAPGPRL